MKNIIKKVSENWVAKLFSLVIAILLWFYVNYENMPVKYISIPIEIKNIPRKLVIASSFNNMVSVKIKGRTGVIQTVYPKDFKAYVDLKNVIIGINYVPIKVKLLRKRKSIRIVNISPQNIKIYIEKLERKEVPVSPTIINSPMEGYIKAGETFFPQTIVIEGPSSIVEKIDVVRTKPIDIGGVTGSIYKEVEFDLPNEFIRTLSYKKIKINIKIKKNYKIFKMENLKVNVRNLNPSLYIVNKEDLFVKKVKVYGPPERLNIIKQNKDFLYVDATDITEDGKYEKQIKYDLPYNCSVVYIEPKKLKLKIEEK